MFATNWAVQPQKMATRGFKFKKERDCTIYEVKTGALFSSVVTAQLICVFFLHMQKAGFLITLLI